MTTPVALDVDYRPKGDVVHVSAKAPGLKIKFQFNAKEWTREGLKDAFTRIAILASTGFNESAIDDMNAVVLAKYGRRQ